MWDRAALSLELADDLTSDPVVTVIVRTPYGPLRVMAEPEVTGATLILRGLHVHGASANAVGTANLMVLAQAVMERMGFDGVVVEGALRTTGANPGHRPRVIRFTRRICPAPATGSRVPPDN